MNDYKLPNHRITTRFRGFFPFNFRRSQLVFRSNPFQRGLGAQCDRLVAFSREILRPGGWRRVVSTAWGYFFHGRGSSKCEVFSDETWQSDMNFDQTTTEESLS